MECGHRPCGSMVAFSCPMHDIDDYKLENNAIARWHDLLRVVKFYCWLHNSLSKSNPAKRQPVLHLMRSMVRNDVSPIFEEYFGVKYFQQLHGTNFAGSCFVVHRTELLDHACTTAYQRVESKSFPELHGLVTTKDATVGTIIADDQFVVWPISDADLTEILQTITPLVLLQLLRAGDNARDAFQSFFAMQVHCAKQEEHASMMEVCQSMISQCKQRKVPPEKTFLPLVSWPDNFSAMALLFNLAYNRIEHTQHEIFTRGFEKYKAQVAMECGLLGTKPADLLLVLALCERFDNAREGWLMFCYIASYHIKYNESAVLSNAFGAANCPMHGEVPNCHFSVLVEPSLPNERHAGQMCTSLLVHSESGLVLASPQQPGTTAPQPAMAALLLVADVNCGKELRWAYEAPKQCNYTYVHPWDKARSDRTVHNLLCLQHSICRVMLLQCMHKPHMQEALQKVLRNTSQPEKYKKTLLAQGWLTQLTH